MSRAISGGDFWLRVVWGSRGAGGGREPVAPSGMEQGRDGGSEGGLPSVRLTGRTGPSNVTDHKVHRSTTPIMGPVRDADCGAGLLYLPANAGFARFRRV